MMYKSGFYLALTAGALLFIGCDEEAPESAADPDTISVSEPEEAPEFDSADLGTAALKKLTRGQYANSLHLVFGEELEVPPTGEPDSLSAGLAAVGASVTPYSSIGVDTFEKAAFAIGEQVLENETLRTRHFPCFDPSDFDESCVSESLQKIGEALWRRPMSEEEIQRVVDVAGEAALALDSASEGTVFGLATLLQSPYFLYRVELGGDGGEDAEARPYTGYELASKLSYFLWNTTPNDDLLEAAANGSLDTEDGLVAEAERMLGDPRAREGLEQFYDEFLELEDAEQVSKDPSVYDFFSLDYGKAAATETRMLLDYLIFEGNRDFRELLTTKTTHLNPLLAALYDLPSPSSSGFTRINLPEGERAGLLGHASFLAQHSHQVSTSVTRRGEAVRLLLLCDTIPSPPVNVDTSIPEPSGNKLTMRDRVEEHLQDPSCNGCHMLTDPIGLGLENFDGIGRYRTLDNGALIDPAGEFDGTAFDGPLGLGQAIANDPKFPNCFVRTLTRYARGREEIESEQPALKALQIAFSDGGYRVQDLIIELIRSPLFREAKGVQ